MRYTDLIFDLYGTLVDIHTEENDLVWEKTALLFGYYGAHYSPEALKMAFFAELRAKEATQGQSYECFPDIPCQEVMESLFHKKGITQARALGIQAAQLFRICATEYVRMYPYAVQALRELRRAGCRLWLLSNAQRVFTEYELRHLGIADEFDGIYISSDYRCRKPDKRFFGALMEEQGLDPERCLMIGNDRHTDIGGARAAGLATLYMHTALTPADQEPADCRYSPERAGKECRHYEYEGDNWEKLSQLLQELIFCNN